MQKLEGPRTLLPPFEGGHLQRARTSQHAPISPQGQIPRLPHGCLNFIGSIGNTPPPPASPLSLGRTHVVG